MKKKIIFTVAILLLCTGLFILYKGLQPDTAKSANPSEAESGFLKNASKPKPQDKVKNNSGEESSDKQSAAPDTSKNTTKETAPFSSSKQGKTSDRLPDNFKVIDTVSNKVLLSTRIDLNNISAGDATLKALASAGIKYKISTFGGAMYVSMIGGIFERSAGPSSGWCYYVNGVKPGEAASSYKLSKDDTVEWKFQKNGLNS